MENDSTFPGGGYLDDVRSLFEQYRTLAEKALKRLSDDEFFAVEADGSNSAAVIVKHIAGNQMSRWTNFLTEDGEKPNRDRDSEFSPAEETRSDLMDRWDRGWKCLFEALSGLAPQDLSRDVTIRGERLSVVSAINRQLTHYAYHTGQIVYLAKRFRGDEWSSLSVPPGRSAEFNDFMRNRPESDAEGKHYLEDARDYFGNGDEPEGG